MSTIILKGSKIYEITASLKNSKTIQLVAADDPSMAKDALNDILIDLVLEI